MKILLAALKYDYGIIARGESLEFKVFYPTLKKIADNVDVFWLEENGYPSATDNIQKQLLDFADKVNPDIVFFILMDNEITAETIENLSAKFTTVNWFCDDQWRFENFTKFVAPKLTYSITTDKFSLAKYKSINYDDVFPSQWATFDYKEDISFDLVKYKYDISFVGSKNATREWIVDELKRKNIFVNCFGAGWDMGKVTYNEMNEIFLTSKINLNLSNSVPDDPRFLKFVIKKIFLGVLKCFTTAPGKSFKNLLTYVKYLKFYFSSTKSIEQIKARNFEIPGCGGFQLSQFALEIEDYYVIGNEIAMFGSVKDLIKQCDYYLANDEIRDNIRVNGYKRTAEHTYYNRLKTIFNKIKF